MQVLRINDMAVAGLDTRNALDSQYAKVVTSSASMFIYYYYYF